jgi:hypothetical protein
LSKFDKFDDKNMIYNNNVPRNRFSHQHHYENKENIRDANNLKYEYPRYYNNNGYYKKWNTNDNSTINNDNNDYHYKNKFSHNKDESFYLKSHNSYENPEKNFHNYYNIGKK